jgi:hypothetical protein
MKFENTKQKLIVVALCALMTLTMVVPSTIPASAQSGAENPNEPQESGDGNQTATEMGNQEPEEEVPNYSGNESSRDESSTSTQSEPRGNSTENESGSNAIVTDATITSTTKFMMETRCSFIKDGDVVTYNVDFPGTPIVITCAQYSNMPKITAPIDINADGFTLKMIDHNGNPVTSNAYVLWIAIYPGQYDDPNTNLMVETRCHWISHNTYVSYNLDFPDVPNVVVCAQTDAIPRIAAPMSHTKDGFYASIYDHNGNTVTGGAWVLWVAVYPSQYDDPNTDLMIETRCNKQHDLVGMTYNLNFPSTPNVVTCGQSDGSGIARITAPVSHTADGYTLRIIDHNGNYVTTQNSVWTFWIAAYPSQYISPIDEYEPDNSFSQYTTITVTTSLQSQSRSISPANDNDYIRFYAYAGNKYTFYTSGSTDTYGYLYNDLQIQLTSNDNSGGGGNFKIDYTILTSGYYFLRVKGYSSSTTGPYTLYYQYGTNNPPSAPSQPSGPTSGNPSVSYTYSTHATDPDGNNVYYWFDWGDGTNSGWVGSYSSGSTGSASHSWSSTGTYSVKAKAKDTIGSESGWSTSLTVTILNSPPNTPTTPSGTSSGYTGLSYTYSSYATDPNGDQIKYYFDWGDGTGTWTGYYNSGATASASHSWASAGTYYVKVKAQDSRGTESGWSSSLTVSIVLNNPPNTPSKPSGTTSTPFYPTDDEPNSGGYTWSKPNSDYGLKGRSYTLSTSTLDPNGDQIKYYFDWGDGTGTWTGYYNSGATSSASHSWSSTGSYSVKVKAQDQKGAESGWSNTLTTTIQMDPDDNSVEVGVEWVNDYGGADNDLNNCDDSAKGLYNNMGSIGWTKNFENGDDNAEESHFQSSGDQNWPDSAEDSNYVDAVDICLFSGHGSADGNALVVHDNLLGDLFGDYVNYDECKWGDRGLKKSRFEIFISHS